MDHVNPDFDSFARRKEVFKNINLIENPHILKVMVIKKKHFEDLEGFSFSENQIIGTATYPPFEILGKHKFSVIIRFTKTGRLHTIHDMDLANFLSGQLRKQMEQEGEIIDGTAKYDIKQDIMDDVMDLPQIILD